MIIIGITGTIGSGKGTVVDYLVENKGFTHYSVRSFLIEEIKRRGMIVDRNSMKLVADDLRRKHGASYMVESLYEKAEKEGKSAVIESIRSLGEVEELKKYENFYLLAVNADLKTRYDRITKRGSESDHVSFEEFANYEKKENNNKESFAMNVNRCMKLADYHIDNSGSLEELYEQIKKLYIFG